MPSISNDISSTLSHKWFFKHFLPICHLFLYIDIECINNECVTQYSRLYNSLPSNSKDPGLRLELRKKTPWSPTSLRFEGLFVFWRNMINNLIILLILNQLFWYLNFLVLFFALGSNKVNRLNHLSPAPSAPNSSS